MKRLLACMSCATLLLPAVALADAATAAPPSGWSGKGQIGLVDTQGNTESKSANGMLDLAYIDAPWKHALHAEGLYGQIAGVTSAERWATQWQSNYSFTPRLFGFGALRYDYDLFSGFQYQGSVTAGAGYQIFETAATKLSAQLGAGYRLLRPEQLIKTPGGVVIGRIPRPRDSDAIVTAGVDFAQVLSATTTLTDKLRIDSGSFNTLITNALALSVQMTTKLALSIGYSLEDNTEPPPGAKKLDSTETINLVFGF